MSNEETNTETDETGEAVEAFESPDPDHLNALFTQGFQTLKGADWSEIEKDDLINYVIVLLVADSIGQLTGYLTEEIQATVEAAHGLIGPALASLGAPEETYEDVEDDE